MMPWPSSMDETHLKLLHQKQLVTSHNRCKYICIDCIVYDMYCISYVLYVICIVYYILCII